MRRLPLSATLPLMWPCRGKSGAGWVSCEAGPGRVACSPPALCGVRPRTLRRVVRRTRRPVRGRADLRHFAKPEVGNAAGRPAPGEKPKPVFCDRLLLTLVHLRHQLPHEVLAEPYDVGRSTLSTAIGQAGTVACGPGLRSARPAWSAATDTERRPRPRRGRRRKNSGSTAPRPSSEAGGPTRTAGPRSGQAPTEHDQDHHVQ